MKRIVLTFGLISGALIACLGVGMVPFVVNGVIPFEYGELVGYSAMVLAFIFVFVGIRQYRETAGGGSITFGRAFKVGILITLITSAMYVASWQVVYHNFIPDFGERYTALTVQRMQKNGASADEIAKARQDMARFMELYRNPLVNIGVTFLEVFPVGLLMTLIAAAFLRRKATPPASATAAVLA